MKTVQVVTADALKVGAQIVTGDKLVRVVEIDRDRHTNHTHVKTSTKSQWCYHNGAHVEISA